jgi:predicted MFS family arabinose efflux permease
MSARSPALAPFAVRSFRFQWPADLATSWALEMEALILGWYILSATGSVQQLMAIGAIAWLGTLFSPLFGIASDRVGHRALLCVTRGVYAVLAAALAALTLAGRLEPWHVFAIAALAGLLKPSDMVMRQALIAQTMRPESLLGALGVSRTTTDSARIAGALAGTAGVALVGMGPAYVVVALLYVAAFLLSLGVAESPRRAIEAHPLADLLIGLKGAFAYVWRKDDLLGAFSIAFFVNLLAFPFFLGLLPYVAKEVYGAGQAGLGWLAAAFATGALAGSLLLGANRMPMRAARAMLVGSMAWYAAILAIGQTSTMAAGLPFIFLAGFMQSYALTPLAAVMLRSSEEAMRGRVMGMRSLAVWGLPLGLLAAGPVIDRLGFAATTVLYAGVGLALTAAIGWRWQAALWSRSSPANARL